MSRMQFRRLNADEFDAAYAILREVTDWLLGKGIRQWASVLPEDVYRKRQDAGQNYGLFHDSELAVVVSLLPYLPAYWEDYPVDAPYTCLATLATALRFKGHDYGREMLQQVEAFCEEQAVPTLYLDCAYGFLPDYYASLGFQPLTRRLFVFPYGDFDSVLMRKTLNGA